MENLITKAKRLLLGGPVATLLLTDQRPKASIKRVTIRIEAGYKLPMGEEVIAPFNLIVEAGVRWHPEWDEPRVTVNGWRFFQMGDSLCWAGDELFAAFGFLLEPEIQGLALFHGKTVDELPSSAKTALDRLRLDPPKAKQPLATFILPEQYGRKVN